MTLSDWSTVGRLYHLFCWISAQPSILSTTIAWYPFWRIASLLLSSHCPGSSRIYLDRCRLLCLQMIAAALLEFVVVYLRARYLVQSRLSPTLKMLWNFSISTVWAIIFSLMISNFTLVLFQTSFIAVATVFRPASVTCKNGAHRAGSNSMPPTRNLSCLALGPLLVDWNRKTVPWKSTRPSWNRLKLSATSASCLTANWPW